MSSPGLHASAVELQLARQRRRAPTAAATACTASTTGNSFPSSHASSPPSPPTMWRSRQRTSGASNRSAGASDRPASAYPTASGANPTAEPFRPSASATRGGASGVRFAPPPVPPCRRTGAPQHTDSKGTGSGVPWHAKPPPTADPAFARVLWDAVNRDCASR